MMKEVSCIFCKKECSLKGIKLHFYRKHSGILHTIRPNKEHADIILRKRTKKSASVRRALLEIGREEKCELCNQLPFWNNKKLTLQIDHIDGDNLNNERTNLRFLCPNCHSQTETFGAKNRKNWDSRKDSQNAIENIVNENIVKDFYFRSREEKKEIFTQTVLSAHQNGKIDFSQFGWVNKLANELNCKHQYVHLKMKQILPEFYIQNCFKRKRQIGI